MFGRTRDEESVDNDSPQDSVQEEAARGGSSVAGARGVTPAKGRPTPTRREREAARRQSIVHADPKAARKAERERVRQERMKVREALETGDERYLPARDQGEQKRFVRQYVDARWNLGELVMPAALVFIALTFALGNNTTVSMYVLVGMYVLFLATFVDSFLLTRKIRKALTLKFGFADKGTGWYGASRALQMRRLRLPKPLTKRGDFPKM